MLGWTLLVVAARLRGELTSEVKDSKLISKNKREVLKYDIEIACDIGEGWVMPAEIDHLGLTGSMKLAVSRALEGVQAKTSETIVIDGNINFCDVKYSKASAVVDADALFPIVSATSVYAKVTRGSYCQFYLKDIRYIPLKNMLATAQPSILPL